jgi:hypothetical protein
MNSLEAVSNTPLKTVHRERSIRLCFRPTGFAEWKNPEAAAARRGKSAAERLFQLLIQSFGSCRALGTMKFGPGVFNGAPNLVGATFRKALVNAHLNNGGAHAISSNAQAKRALTDGTRDKTASLQRRRRNRHMSPG